MPDMKPIPHPYCDAALQKLKCSAVCDNSAIMDLITRPADENYSPVMSYEFWLFFFLLIVAWSSMAVVGSVGDAICFGMLGKETSFNLYCCYRIDLTQSFHVYHGVHFFFDSNKCYVAISSR